MMKRNMLLIVYLLGFTSSIFVYSNGDALKENNREISTSFFRKKKKKVGISDDSVPKQKEAPYTKIFKGKKYKTVKGLITLHLVEDKLYIEFPLELIDKDLILSSHLDKVSEFGTLNVGQNANNTLFFSVSKTDSIITLSRKNGLALVTNKEDENVKSAIRKSNIPSIIFKAPTLAFSPDSLSVVFDGTPFFMESNNYIVSFTTKPKNDKTILHDVAAYDNSISIYTDMTIDVPTNIIGLTKPLSFTVNTTISLLPDKVMDFRFADSRVGTGVTQISTYDGINQGLKHDYVSRRWRLDLLDTTAYKNGSLVSPIKPLVFYVDTLFSDECMEGIKLGFEKWNAAFEKIGYKNTISVFPYPANDSTFDANNNLTYNCIKYIQSAGRNIIKNIKTDPRSGEILSASLYFPRDMFIPIHSDRLIQTGSVDKRVRNNELPKEILKETVAAIILKEAGFCLGLTDNLAGSSWYDVDSLRSPTFTSTNGLSASVMDDVLYNYVAQPGDLERGVKMVNTDLGVYDYFAIKWLYKPILDNSVSEEKILSQWIDEHKDDVRYKFIPRPSQNQIAEDPRAIRNTLGNDVIKSTTYALKNYKYIMDNYLEWIDKPDTDDSYKMLFPEFIFLHTLTQLRHLAYPLGGIYINSDVDGNKPVYTTLSSKKQREILMRALDAIKQINWINNKENFKKSGAFYTNMTNPLIASPLVQILNRLPVIAVSGSFTDDPYSAETLLNDLTRYVTKGLRTQGNMNLTDRRMLEWIIMCYNAEIKKVFNPEAVTKSQTKAIYGFSNLNSSGVGNYNIQPSDFIELLENVSSDNMNNQDWQNVYKTMDIQYVKAPDLSVLYYKNLKDIYSALKYKQNITNDELLKSYCAYYEFEIQKILKGK
ncbi:zinc-dependent metalloprotease [Dysgonomonas sp. Marseille-P4677]|uniref:zinc-dependent metalloprotease n=1 Tax=Dysgonomonas sp. Marseille-P4677 TaxID=2364790 RepID=UPI001912D8D3|nr:zinc-dependent metalloprotease [Dysgonomonas sp. Marseille-P4677]MBK5721830.1 zinc-dependent metalloprotease [Dysgonomonas sp. Marseille-P4677]